MPRPFVYHLDDFRQGLSVEAFRLFSLLDELQLITAEAKHSLAQCCASALPSMIDPAQVLRLVVFDCLEQMANDPATKFVILPAGR